MDGGLARAEHSGRDEPEHLAHHLAEDLRRGPDQHPDVQADDLDLVPVDEVPVADRRFPTGQAVDTGTAPIAGSTMYSANAPPVMPTPMTWAPGSTPDTPTVVQGLSVQARDGATRDELEAVITCAMAAWEALTSTPSNAEVSHTGG